jgi:hypothetical protein
VENLGISPGPALAGVRSVKIQIRLGTMERTTDRRKTSRNSFAGANTMSNSTPAAFLGDRAHPSISPPDQNDWTREDRQPYQKRGHILGEEEKDT